MKEIDRIKERYEFSFDVRQLGLILFGVFAIAALVFVLGISVGIQWELRKAPEMKTVTASAGLEKKPVPVVPAAPPVYTPVTTAKPEPVKADEKTQKPEKGQKAPRIINKEQEPADLTFPKVLNSSSRKPAPLVPEKPDKKEQKPGAAGRYTVQVGAYADKAAAQARADRLKGSGIDARVYTAEGKKGKYNYKVHVGLFDTKDKASAMAKKLGATEKPAPFVALEE
ncbi:MAG: SPOR domain-containing protein [Nitrospirota bacterium]